MRRYEYGPLHCLSKWVLQQRHAAAISNVPSRKSATEAAIQLLSPVLGSAAVVAVADLDLDGVDTVVLAVSYTHLDVYKRQYYRYPDSLRNMRA